MSMKLQSCYFCLILATGLNFAYAKDAPISAEQLRNKLESALKACDTNAVLSLFCSEGPTNEWKDSAYMREMFITRETSVMLLLTNVSVKMAPMPANFPLLSIGQHNGFGTKLNVAAVGILEVRGGDGTSVQLPYGKIGNDFCLAGTILEPIPGRHLGIRVLAGPNSDVLTYTGRWVYVKAGEEISVEISDKTNQFVTGWGDYIKSCEIQRTSLDKVPGFSTWFYFQIKEGGTNVYESPQLTNEDRFIYQKTLNSK